MTNAAFSTEPKFVAACEAAGIPATTAQASKYRRKFGLAYTHEHGYTKGSRINEVSGDSSAQRGTGNYKPMLAGPYSSNPNGKK